MAMLVITRGYLRSHHWGTPGHTVALILIALVRRKHQLRSRTCKRSKPTASRFFKGRRMVRLNLRSHQIAIRQTSLDYPELMAMK